MPDGAGGNPSHRMRMTVAFANSMLTPPKTNSGDIDAWLVLPRVHRVVLVVDVVESVRLMEQDEEDTITRWRAFVHGVERELLPQHGGRLVKSLGDGLMLEFERVLPAVQSALAMQQLARTMNQGRAAERCMFLRMGVHAADVVVDERDIYGAGVNLAARLATLAGPGEVVVSAHARDQLVPGLDVEIQDLGQCYLKHVKQTQRAFRVSLPGPAPVLARERPLIPTIAVAPLAVGASIGDSSAAQVMTDDLVIALSRCPYWRVLSRLSTASLAKRDLTPRQSGQLLKADYLLSGRLHAVRSGFRVFLELADVRSDVVVWGDALNADEREMLAGGGGAQGAIVAGMLKALLQREHALMHEAVLPTMPAYSLLLQSISCMHHMDHAHVSFAHQALHHLADRHPRASEVHAWQAMWHFIQIFQTWSDDPEADATLARSCLQRAVDADPRHAFTRALLGHACVALDRDLPKAESHLAAAIEVNANEPLAWLFLSQVLAYSGQALSARDAVERATALTPFDPLSYLFENFASTVYGAIEEPELSLACARQAVALNAMHLPSLARLIVAQMLAGHADEARATARRYLAHRPRASVQRFLDHHPALDRSIAFREAGALRAAGIPL